MNERILHALRQLEEQENLKIVYAVESGSRAWGFASPNSDWDVRFLYIRPEDWYLSIDERRDVIERMLPGDLDLAGWDFKKALKLFRKSNPPLLEWLRSPLIYLEHGPAAQQMRALSEVFFNPKSCMYHYLSMARGNFKAYLNREQVPLKKYFYVLRPILACMWTREKGTMAPMEFEILRREMLPEGHLQEIVDELLRKKMSAQELAEGPQIPGLNQFLEEKIEEMTLWLSTYTFKSYPDTAQLNTLFRTMVREQGDW